MCKSKVAEATSHVLTVMAPLFLAYRLSQTIRECLKGMGQIISKP